MNIATKDLHPHQDGSMKECEDMRTPPWGQQALLHPPTSESLEGPESHQHGDGGGEYADDGGGQEGHRGPEVDRLATETVRGGAADEGCDAYHEHVNRHRGRDELGIGVEVLLNRL